MMEKIIKENFYLHFITCRYKKTEELAFYKRYFKIAEGFFKNFYEIKEIPNTSRAKIEKKVLGRELEPKERSLDEDICTWDIVRAFLTYNIREKSKPPYIRKFTILDQKGKNRLLIYYYYLLAGIEHKNVIPYLKWTIDNDLDVFEDLPEMFLNMKAEGIRKYLFKKGVKIEDSGEINPLRRENEQM